MLRAARREAWGEDRRLGVVAMDIIIVLAAIMPSTPAVALTGTTATPQRMWDPLKGVAGLEGTGLVQLNDVKAALPHWNGESAKVTHQDEENNGLSSLKLEHTAYGGVTWREAGLAGLGVDNVTMANQTAQLGSTAFLHCLIRGGGDKKVSWVRLRDYQVLTSGRQSYSRDQRFGLARAGVKGDWTLVVKYVQRRDQGVYECQVSTRTGKQGHLVYLKVEVPEAVIEGTPERHVQAGSTLTLTCHVQGGLTPPEYILWHHDSRILNYGGGAGGVVVERRPLQPSHAPARLVLPNTAPHHSGVYTCTAPHTAPSSVTVFVSRGDKTAAIQRLGSGVWGVSSPHSVPSRLLLLLLACCGGRLLS